MFRYFLSKIRLHNNTVPGGFYSIEQKLRRLRLVALNTNLWTGEDEGEDPGGQWAWLEAVMARSYRHKETVFHKLVLNKNIRMYSGITDTFIQSKIIMLTQNLCYVNI